VVITALSGILIFRYIQHRQIAMALPPCSTTPCGMIAGPSGIASTARVLPGPGDCSGSTLITGEQYR
jgi:hypothetical protein